MGNFPIGLIGEKVDLKYPYKHLGSSSLDIKKLKNKNNEFSLKLLNAQRPMIIVGMGAFTNDNGSVILNELRELAEYLGVVKKEWNGFNILQTSAGRTGALDIGFIPSKKGLNAKQIFSKGDEGDLSFIWLMGVDNKDVLKLKKPFVVYQGHHGDVGAHIADVILPGAAYTEKSATYVNTEGRPQLAKQATFPPGDAKEDWKIIRAFSDYVKNKLPFDDLESLRNKLYDEFPHLGDIDEIKKARWSKFGTKGKIDNIELKSSIENFYNTCSISRTSETMATCLNNNINKIAAE